MKFIPCCVAFLLIISNYTSAQITETIYPKKDASIKSNTPTTNLGNHGRFSCKRSTASGTPFTRRSFMEFDLSHIPPGSEITSVTLYLYAPGAHQWAVYSTESSIEKVSQSWGETTVTWNNQPGVDLDFDPAALPSATSSEQDYTVSSGEFLDMVQDMVDDPANNFGIRMKLDNEENFPASLVFGSSDNTNSDLHPKLVITYHKPRRFALLTNELDGSYYKAYEGKLFFKYTEEYRPDTLNFNIVNDFSSVILKTTDVKIPTDFGANWVFIDLNPHTEFTTGNYYILTVLDPKNRPKYLRFQMAGADTDNSSATMNSNIQHIKYGVEE